MDKDGQGIDESDLTRGRKRRTGTQRRRRRAGGAWSDILTSQETPRTPQTPEARRGAQDTFTSEAPEETSPVDTLLSDF